MSNNLTTPLLTPTLAFTANSIHISYDTTDIFNFTEGIAEFQIATTAVPTIPAPSAILLGTFGVGLVSWMKQRRGR